MSNMLSLQDKRVLMRGIIRLTYMSLIAVMSSFVSSCDSEPMYGEPIASPFIPEEQQIEIPSDGGSVVLYTCEGWRESKKTMPHPIPDFVGGFPLREWNIPIDRAEFDFDTTPLYLWHGIAPPTGGMDGVYFLDGVYKIFLDEHPDGSLTAKVRWLDVRITENTLEVRRHYHPASRKVGEVLAKRCRLYLRVRKKIGIFADDAACCAKICISCGFMRCLCGFGRQIFIL